MSIYVRSFIEGVEASVRCLELQQKASCSSQ